MNGLLRIEMAFTVAMFVKEPSWSWTEGSASVPATELFIRTSENMAMRISWR